MKTQRRLARICFCLSTLMGCDEGFDKDHEEHAECGPGTVLKGDLCLPECVDGQLVEGCVPISSFFFEFKLEDPASAYEAVTPAVIAMGADDGAGHLEQAVLAEWAEAGVSEEQIEFLFEHGDELSELDFKEADGVGSLRMADGTALASRFTRTPTGGRFTGPNASSCASCHSAPIGNSGGPIMANVMQDPEPLVEGMFNARQTISMQGGGLIQILAEDLTEELQALKGQAMDEPDSWVELVVAGGKIDFGALRCASAASCDYTKVVGVSADLIVRPMGWKGNFPTIRGFSSDAAFGEMGMQADEVLWKLTTEPHSAATPDSDGDGDGVTHELSVGDITALTLYLAAQEMPTTVVELADAGMAELADEQRAEIQAGQDLFERSTAQGGLGCASCHVPQLRITTTMFSEPSPRASGAFEDLDLAGRQAGYASSAPIVMDLAGDVADAPRVTALDDGSAVLRPYTDLKRHFMGDHLADDAKVYFPKDASQFDRTEMPDDADAASSGLSPAIGLGEFLTPELWGVGNTGPWLHDGRALTLREAIMLHGQPGPVGRPSEAQSSRDAFASSSAAEQDQVVAFLLNLVVVEMGDAD